MRSISDHFANPDQENETSEDATYSSVCRVLCGSAFIDETLIRLMAESTSGPSGSFSFAKTSFMDIRKQKSIKFRRQRREIKLKLHGDEFVNRREGQKN